MYVCDATPRDPHRRQVAWDSCSWYWAKWHHWAAWRKRRCLCLRRWSWRSKTPPPSHWSSSQDTAQLENQPSWQKYSARYPRRSCPQLWHCQRHEVPRGRSPTANQFIPNNSVQLMHTNDFYLCTITISILPWQPERIQQTSILHDSNLPRASPWSPRCTHRTAAARREAQSRIRLACQFQKIYSCYIELNLTEISVNRM